MISPEATSEAGVEDAVDSAPAEGGAEPGGWHARWRQVWEFLRENRKAAVGLFIVLVFILVAIIGPFIAPYNPTQFGVGGSQEHPSSAHWLGTTQLGQDIFSQVLVGARGSLEVGFATGFFTTLLAVIVGLTAGYLGGWVDDTLSILTNVFLTLPFIPIMIVVASYAAAFNVKGPLVLVGVLTLTGWAWGARVKRSQVLTLRNKDFVMAARVAGESWVHIVFFEIVPNMLSLIAASFLFSTIFAILGEAALEFIGLGDPTSVTWGVILNQAETNSALLQGAWFWFIPPGLCIGIFALGLALVNYAIDEVTNPKLRVQKVRSDTEEQPPQELRAARPTNPTESKTNASIA
jgi:peptide/nickel transport system permease protein